MRGFTFIELLVVISILAITTMVSVVYYKDFSADQATKKAVGQVQSLIRLAQSNATSYTKCPDPGAADQSVKSWYLVFTNATNIDLRCDTASTTNYTLRSYILENVGLTIQGDSGCPIGFSATLSYRSGVGTQSISSSDISVTPACLNSSRLTFTLSNQSNPSSSPIPFNVSKGGSINVQ
ncbi:prepilin-type N-terminal cleavage/methylation domain-containing protein [Candidatus Daviesbacteria bacterium]|nr:prepilin-type N-terminal cleavage/methylation domain-containing protein [Candidatus Daviesbacteria bacterium]